MLGRLGPRQRAVLEAIGRHNESPLDAEHLRISEEGGRVELWFEATAASRIGFDVGAVVREGSYTLWCDEGWHDEFPLQGDPEEDARLLVARLADLLEGRAKLLIRYAGGSPYRWRLVVADAEKWQAYFLETGLLFYNYFGRRALVAKVNEGRGDRLVDG